MLFMLAANLVALGPEQEFLCRQGKELTEIAINIRFLMFNGTSIGWFLSAKLLRPLKKEKAVFVSL